MEPQSGVSPGAPENAIELAGVSKRYGGARGDAAPALDRVDLTVPRGSLFGLLGPNGAGKSTLINILAGLVLKSAGRAMVWGTDIDRDPRQARALIGVVPQELNIDAFFTPREVLTLQAGMYGVAPADRRTEAILALVGLTDRADNTSRSLSGGMRRRLMVGKAMVHDPPVLVLDEPNAGVDVELRHRLWDSIRALRDRGVTILLTTHYLNEAEALCDRIAILDHGRIIACDETGALVRRLDHKDLYVTTDRDLPATVAALPPVLAALAPRLDGPRRLRFRYRAREAQAARILDALNAAGLGVADLSTVETDLEDVFLDLVRSQPAADGGDSALAPAAETGRLAPMQPTGHARPGEAGEARGG